MVRSGCPTGGHLSLWGLEQAARETIEGSPFFEQASEAKTEGSPAAMAAGDAPSAARVPESLGGTGASGAIVLGLEGSPTSTTTQLFDHDTSSLSPQTVGPPSTTSPHGADRVSSDAGTGMTSGKTFFRDQSTLDYTLGRTRLPVCSPTRVTRATNTCGDGAPRGGLLGHNFVGHDLSAAGDAECWARLHEQLRSLQQNVQNFANRRSSPQLGSKPVASAPGPRRIERAVLVESKKLQSPRLLSPSKPQHPPVHVGIQHHAGGSMGARCTLGSRVACFSPREPLPSPVPSLTGRIAAVASPMAALASPRQRDAAHRGAPLVAPLHPAPSPQTPCKANRAPQVQASSVCQPIGSPIAPSAGYVRSVSVVNTPSASASARKAPVRSSSANPFSQRVMTATPRVVPPPCAAQLLRPASAAKLHQLDQAGTATHVASTPSVPVSVGVARQPRFVPVAGMGTSAQGSQVNAGAHSPRQPVQATSWIQASRSPRAQTPVGPAGPRMQR
mmetsp:Transcript_37108/g.104689  ORF Transcript_37108/g.104689 Transcript_37108/m.104689 type:complete len:502 (+) Transcript_37108:130-1635(+)